jgi:hypothetical protein
MPLEWQNVKLEPYSIFPHRIVNAIDTIVRELEQIPEPMQLSVLDFIRSLDSSDRTKTQSETGVEVNNPSGKRSTTSTRIAGKGRTLGDIVNPIVDEQN